MNILIRFIIILTFILIAVFPFFLNAKSCDFPNIDGCEVKDTNKVYQINHEDISITGNSNLEIGSIILSKETFNLSMKDSKLSLNRIIPYDTKYTLNIDLDNSSFTFRNSNSITIEKLTFNGDIATPSVFTVQGFSNVMIDELITAPGSKSVLKIKSSLSTVNLKKANLNNVFITNGYLRVREGGTEIDSIVNVDPEDIPEEGEETEEPPVPENGYIDLNKGGRIEILEKGKLTVGDIDASQLHVINGEVNINGKYNIDLIDNLKSGSEEDPNYEESEEDKKADKIINIGTGAEGMVNTIRVRDLNLKGKMSVQHTGSIENLNYVKDENGEYVGDATKGILIYEGKKIPDKDGKIKENDPTPKLTLRNVYLDQLILNDGDISILNRDSIINNITNPTEKGTLSIEYVKNMQSTDVQINNLSLLSTSYKVANNFEVKNLKMTIGSELILAKNTPLNFESLDMGSNTKITVENNGNLDITVSKNLSVFNTMLNVNDLTFSGNADDVGTLKIAVDKNLIDEKSNKFETGISAKGSITLENTNIVADIQNTSMFNLSTAHSYNVLQADGGITWDGGVGSTNLPEWFSSRFDIDGNKLVVNVERKLSYKQLLDKSGRIDDINTQNIAKSLDKMVSKGYFGRNGVDKVISNIDLKSDIYTIGANLASLKPIDNNIYIHDVHSNATASLDMLLQNSSYSYLKTKNTESDIIWIRNGFKQGKLNPDAYVDGNKYSSYFAMAGFDIFAVDSASSYFQIGVSGGFNFSDINARSGLYDIASVGYNVALYSNFIADHFVFSLNALYVNNSYDSDRYSVSDAKVTSNNNVSEILTNVEVGTKFSVLDNISYDSSILKILGVNNLLARPTVFYTNGYINGDKVVEKGNAGYNLGSYSTMIHDAGLGILLYSTNDNVSTENSVLQGSYIPYMEVKTFYRTYNVPDTVVGFIDMGEDYDINIIGDNKDGMVVKTSFGVDYEKDAHILGLKYSYEHGFKNYSDHGFYLNYKFLLN